MRRLAAFALCLLAALPAAARPLDDGERRGLDKAVAAYSRALERGDAQALTGTLPPRLLRFHAGMTGMTVQALEKAMTDQTEAMMADTRFGALEADTAVADVAEATLADGTEVLWAVLPAAFETETAGARTKVSQPVLALFDEGKWYLIRIDPTQAQVLAAVYPFLAGVELPAATVAPVN